MTVCEFWHSMHSHTHMLGRVLQIKRYNIHPLRRERYLLSPSFPFLRHAPEQSKNYRTLTPTIVPPRCTVQTAQGTPETGRARCPLAMQRQHAQRVARQTSRCVHVCRAHHHEQAFMLASVMCQHWSTGSSQNNVHWSSHGRVSKEIYKAHGIHCVSAGKACQLGIKSADR